MSSWDEIRGYVVDRYVVEKDYGEGFLLWVEGAQSRFLMLAAKNNPGWGSDDYVTFESMLGEASQVDCLVAAKIGAQLMGGAVCVDETVSLRDSRCLATLTTGLFGTCLGRLVGLTEGYHLLIEQAGPDATASS
jgi:hypothetical protein